MPHRPATDLALVDVPESCQSIGGGCSDQLAVFGKTRIVHQRAVYEVLPQLSRGDLPDPRRSIAAGGNDQPSVRTESGMRHDGIVRQFSRHGLSSTPPSQVRTCPVLAMPDPASPPSNAVCPSLLISSDVMECAPAPAIRMLIKAAAVFQIVRGRLTIIYQHGEGTIVIQPEVALPTVRT